MGGLSPCDGPGFDSRRLHPVDGQLEYSSCPSSSAPGFLPEANAQNVPVTEISGVLGYSPGGLASSICPA